MERILTKTPPWVGQIESTYDEATMAIWRLRGATAATGTFVGTLRGSRMRRRDGVFDQFGALLQFPSYFGENWNAFLECMRDLDWLRTSGCVLVVFDPVEVLADGDAGEFSLLLKRLSQVGECWSEADEFRPARPFRVLLHATPEQSAGLRARLDAAGASAAPFEWPVE
jgi:hypothetical protein